MKEDVYLGDLITIVRLNTATEANLVQGMLVAAGIPASVADANLVQAHPWMSTAVGGVRVTVPSACEQEALKAIEDYRAGAFQLQEEGDEGRAADEAPTTTDLRLWGPDLSAAWSLWLTPVFGSLVHYLNSRALKHRQRAALLWLVACTLITLGVAWLTLQANWEAASGMQIAARTSAVTVAWYVLSGHAQSRHIAACFGSRYVKRPLLPMWFAAAFCLWAIGAVSDVL